jgi:hypothetical protein
MKQTIAINSLSRVLFSRFLVLLCTVLLISRQVTEVISNRLEIQGIDESDVAIVICYRVRHQVLLRAQPVVLHLGQLLVKQVLDPLSALHQVPAMSLELEAACHRGDMIHRPHIERQSYNSLMMELLSARLLQCLSLRDWSLGEWDVLENLVGRTEDGIHQT